MKKLKVKILTNANLLEYLEGYLENSFISPSGFERCLIYIPKLSILEVFPLSKIKVIGYEEI